VAITICSLTLDEIALMEARSSGFCEDEMAHILNEPARNNNDTKNKRFFRKKEELKSVVTLFKVI